MLNQTTKALAEVFRDVDAHLKINRIIKKHATNPGDIRAIALQSIDFTQAEKILDLGCGFGFFSQALRGKLPPQAEVTGIDCHPGYRDSYMESCKNSGFKGSFIGECITSIRRIKSNSIDVIICSYALYFFPEILPHISRILKDEGVFAAITHSRHHLYELGLQVKKVILNNGGGENVELPYEALIDKFSAENGEKLLAPWFDTVRTEKYDNSLIFNQSDLPDIEAYLRFKHSFFIPENTPEKDELHKLVLNSFVNHLKMNREIRISKNDVIFTCTKPTMKGKAR